jgi:adenylylsulfate kinase
MQGKEIQYLRETDWSYLRNKKEEKLRQHAKVIWMCGLSGAGKSTIAFELERELYDHGYIAQVLDGDCLRSGLNKDLGFSTEDRTENLRRIAELSRLFISGGIITINAFISPSCEIRDQARRIIGHQDFIEVFINAPLQICEQRDKKGLYEKARLGLIKDFTGIDSPFEAPENPSIEIKTNELGIQESVDKLLKFILPHIAYKK